MTPEQEAIYSASSNLTQFIVVPIIVLVIGVVLGFKMRRRELGERFRAMPLIVAIGVVLVAAHGSSRTKDAHQSAPAEANKAVTNG